MVLYALAAALLLGAGYLLGVGQWPPGFLAHSWRALRAAGQRSHTVPALRLDLSFAGYQQLLSQRELALQRGANIYPPESEGWGEGALRYEGGAMPVSLRLAAAPAAAFSGTRWPLELDCAEPPGCLGAGRAELHPVQDASALWSAGLLSTLEQEGFPVVAYRWVRLYVNGEGWGLYTWRALPSGDASPAAQPVVALDQRAWLEALAAPGELPPAPSFPYSQIILPEAMASQTLLLDSTPSAYAQEARVALQRLLRDDAATALDATTWGRYLAWRALWCASPWPDWRTAAWVYDGERGRLLPVGAPCAPEGDAHRLPPSFFADLAVQEALVQELTLLSMRSSATFSETLTHLAPLHTAASPLFEELPMPTTWLEQQQTRLRSWLAPSYPLLATASPENAGPGVQVELVNVLPLPVEVLGLDLSESGFIPATPAWAGEGFVVPTPVSSALILPATWGVAPATATLHVPAGSVMLDRGDDIWVVARVWGAEPADMLPQVAVGVGAAP